MPHFHTSWQGSRFLLVATLIFTAPVAAIAATITVNSAGDSNARDNVLTLREAILYTNGTLGLASFDPLEQNQIDETTNLARDAIEFGIAGGSAATINMGSSLPRLIFPVFIDGTTQLGAAATAPGIAINGQGAVSTALEVAGAAGGSELRGLAIGGFASHAIFLNVSTGNVVAANHLGVDLAGTAAFPNGIGGITNAGVRVNGGTSNTIGGIAAADRNIISGNNRTGIFLTSSAQGVRIIGNHIGTDITGTAALPNLGEGMRLDASPTNNTVGGPTPAERNIISGNGQDGIHVRGDENTIIGNYIGTDVTGEFALPNSLNGLHIGERTSDENTVGGTNDTPGVLNVGNLISGNAQAGIKIQGASTLQPENVFRGNFIGTNASGTLAVPNAVGISVEDDPDDTLQAGTLNLIGGANTTPGSLDVGNLVSGNTGPGIRLGQLTSSNTIQGNYIGTQADGTSALPNGTAGIELQGSTQQNVIGNSTAGVGNVIAFNDGPGLLLTGSGTERNDIRGNAVYSNTGPGIDLGGDGVTANDIGDVDANPNQLQNFPVLVSGGTAVVGSLSSQADTDYRIDVYANTAVDGSGNGEGEVYLGSGMATTDGSGQVDFDLAVSSGLLAGKPWISVTATDPDGNTSEFSVPADCLVASAPTFTIDNQTADTAAGTARDSCEGLTSVALDAGASTNVSFSLVSGAPNQSHWNFEITLLNRFAPGTAVVIATDGNGSSTPQAVELTGSAPAIFADRFEGF